MGRDNGRAWQIWMEAQQKLMREDKHMDVFTTEIEVTDTVPGVGIDLTDTEAAKLRRVCQFNKTIHKRVAERDGEDAGQEMDDFLCDLGESLEEEGIERWDPRED